MILLITLFLIFARLQAAVLYHNENVNRPADRYKSGPKKGEVIYKIARSKDNKLEPRAKVVKVKPTFGTITTMMSTVLDSIHSIPFVAVTLNVNPHYVSILQYFQSQFL